MHKEGNLERASYSSVFFFYHYTKNLRIEFMKALIIKPKSEMPIEKSTGTSRLRVPISFLPSIIIMTLINNSF